MPRQARIVIPNNAHHVTQRGNYRQAVFKEEEDYRKYCGWIKEYSSKYKLKIHAYCLMRNHVHFIVVPRHEDSIARVFNTAHMRHAQHMNRKKKAQGHLWQGRFFSCVLDEAHLYRAIRYVERNPVEATLVKRAWEYTWSSARAHVGTEEALIALHAAFDMTHDEWKRYLQENDPQMAKEIALKTQRGLVVGTERFIRRMERKLNRSLECLNPGRPWRKVRKSK